MPLNPGLAEGVIAGARALGAEAPVVQRVVRVAEGRSGPLAAAERLSRPKPETVQESLSGIAKPQDRSETVKKTNELIDTRRNPDTYAKETDNALTPKRQEADRKAGLINETLSQGYDGLSDSTDPRDPTKVITVAEKQTALRDMVLSEIRTRPEFAETIRLEGEKAVAERMLRDPRFLTKLDSKFADALSRADTNLRSADVSAAEITKKTSQLERDARETELTARETELTEVTDRLKEFTEPAGPAKQRIDELRPQERQLRRAVSQHERQTAFYQQQARQAEQVIYNKNADQGMKAAAQASLTQAQSELARLSSDATFLENQQKLFDYEDLNAEMSDLKSRQSSLTREITDLKKSRIEGQQTAVLADEAVQETHEKKVKAITAYSQELDGAIGASAKEYAESRLSDELRALRDAKPAAEAELLQKRDKNEQRLSEQLETQLFDGTEERGRYKSRWARESKKSAARRLGYRLLGRPEPLPEMIPHGRWIEEDFRRMLRNPDQVLSGMEFDGTSFNNLPKAEQDMIRRNLVRESVDVRRRLYNKPLRDNERRMLLKQDWVNQAIIDNVPIHDQLRDQLSENGITEEELKNIKDKNVLAKIKRLMAGKGNLFLMALLVAGGVSQMATTLNSSGNERQG
jgi:hypothetical protein